MRIWEHLSVRNSTVQTPYPDMTHLSREFPGQSEASDRPGRQLVRFALRFEYGASLVMLDKTKVDCNHLS